MEKKMYIKEIPIKEWLTHYRLEDVYYTIFVKGYYETIDGVHHEGKYSHLLTSIKTNVDLLFHLIIKIIF